MNGVEYYVIGEAADSCFTIQVPKGRSYNVDIEGGRMEQPIWTPPGWICVEFREDVDTLDFSGTTDELEERAEYAIFDTGDAFDVDDNGFGAPPDDGFGDFDDFAAPASGQTMDDDFGDFGDFGTGEAAGGFEAGSIHGFGEDANEVDPLPSPRELAEQVKELLGLCRLKGSRKILVTPESRGLYGLLTQPPRGASRPPTWTRSRIRQQHLISLGIPVNLDEVLPQSALKPLPVLHIQTEAAHLPRPLSAPPGPRPGEPLQGRSAGTGSARGSRTGTPAGSPVSSSARRLPPTASSALRLGPKPQIDNKRIEESLSMTHDNLSLLPLAQLEAHLATMRTLTSSSSALLSHLLQQREALQQDSETYNGLIAELVGEAQKMKSGGSRGRTGVVKRGSLM
ncbi:hypothetical protein RhiLY_00556 [Ceratobasidium sp. AG-Ba]|nr:hypothetical protein RhiLY_00556 [Ceratobasidium sp. AG-Ba]